jgi:hypothetical protein
MVAGSGTLVGIGLIVSRTMSSSVKSLPLNAVFWLTRDSVAVVFAPEFQLA